MTAGGKREGIHPSRKTADGDVLSEKTLFTNDLPLGAIPVRDLITKSGLMHWTRVGTDPANFDLKEVSRRDKPPATAASDLHLRRRGA
ncbi:hypothetical protein EVAR_89581_1 [Eumeta japonica]|uniref:Uncharacterized protein n=1 Tax=Eumeta variegata TaxID=151549 RepID=A0A4C1SII1_EUMVA|nr:hypothetical protein EVAR_89581_1 [Eumeta japonica]